MIQICIYYVQHPHKIIVISNDKTLNIFSSIAHNSTIASYKQSQRHNNLVTIRRAKLKGAHKHSKSI